MPKLMESSFLPTEKEFRIAEPDPNMGIVFFPPMDVHLHCQIAPESFLDRETEISAVTLPFPTNGEIFRR